MRPLILKKKKKDKDRSELIPNEQTELLKPSKSQHLTVYGGNKI